MTWRLMLSGFARGGVFPAHFEIRGDVLLVPDLHGRLSLFDKDNCLITHLGHDPEWTKQVLGDGKFPVRGNKAMW